MLRRALDVFILLILFNGGCGQSKTSLSANAGSGPVLTINSVPASLPVWSIAMDSPLVKLGGSLDPDLDFGPQPLAVRLSDGRLMAFDRGAEWPIRIYAPDGTLLKKFRSGGGPDEFFGRTAQPVLLPGDTVLVWNSSNAPMKMITPTYEVRSPSVAFLPSGSLVDVVGRLSDGSWMAVRELMDSVPQDNPPDDFESRWIIWSSDTTKARSILKFQRQPSNPGYSDVLFAPVTATCFRGSVGYFAYNRTPEIDVHDTSGRLLRRIRLDLPAQPVTEKDVSAYFADAGISEAEAKATSGGRFIPKYFPFFDRPLEVDDEGNIWVMLYRKRFLSDARHFLIFSRQGRLIAQASLPAGTLDVLSVHSDVMLLRTQDEGTGHWYLHVVSIRKQGASAVSTRLH